MPSGGHNRISREELLEALERLADDIGETPTRTEMNNLGEYSGSSYVREFGNWNDALESADLPVNHTHHRDRVEYECDQCGQTDSVLESQVNGSNYFCSRQCKWEYQAESVVGEDHHQWNRVECECAFCGAVLYRKPSIVETRDRLFCDSECMGRYRQSDGNPNWRGGVAEDYGRNWENKRKKALERDAYQCQGCGLSMSESDQEYGVSLHVHHLIPRRKYISSDGFDATAANRLENLVTLCPSCHRMWERIPLRPRIVE